MADEFVTMATKSCKKELQVLKEDRHYEGACESTCLNKPVSLLKTTQNTRDLGGYRTKAGTLTKEHALIRSDVQNYPDEEFRKKYGDAESYFKSIGLVDEEIQRIRNKLLG